MSQRPTGSSPGATRAMTSVSLRVAGFIPNVTLPTATARTPIPLRSRRHAANILVRVHSAECQACRAYVSELADHLEELVVWGGRVLIVVVGRQEDAARFEQDSDLPFAVLHDEEGRVLPLSGAGVVIADRFGQIYYVADAGQGHDLPDVAALESWCRFLDTQCPE